MFWPILNIKKTILWLSYYAKIFRLIFTPSSPKKYWLTDSLYAECYYISNAVTFTDSLSYLKAVLQDPFYNKLHSPLIPLIKESLCKSYINSRMVQLVIILFLCPIGFPGIMAISVQTHWPEIPFKLSLWLIRNTIWVRDSSICKCGMAEGILDHGPFFSCSNNNPLLYLSSYIKIKKSHSIKLSLPANHSFKI